MDNLPRRSPRLSQLHQQQSPLTSRSASAQSSFASTAAYPSPAEQLAQQQDQLRLQLQPQFRTAASPFNAPLPSPSATSDYNPFFGYVQTPQASTQMPQQAQQTAPQSHSQYVRAGVDKNQYTQANNHNTSFPSQQRPNAQNAGTPGQLPPDFLAEAARRAQIACLMRDLSDVTL